MKLFEHSDGFIISFGFNMVERKRSPRMVCWSDPKTGEWEKKPGNQAGYFEVQYDLETEFAFETNGRVIAYQPGRCIEMQYLGAPLVWGVYHMTAGNPPPFRRAA